jgi:hypothetical protein
MLAFLARLSSFHLSVFSCTGYRDSEAFDIADGSRRSCHINSSPEMVLGRVLDGFFIME